MKSSFDIYKIGDRIIAIDNIDGRPTKNKMGTVINNHNGYVTIDFDENINGHDCDGMCKDYNGWHIFNPDNIKLFKKPSKHVKQLQFESTTKTNPFLNKKIAVIVGEDSEKVKNVVKTMEKYGVDNNNLINFLSKNKTYGSTTCINVSNNFRTLTISDAGFYKYDGYKVINYNEFLKMTEQKISKNVKQLQFESVKPKNVKLGDLLKIKGKLSYGAHFKVGEVVKVEGIDARGNIDATLYKTNIKERKNRIGSPQRFYINDDFEHYTISKNVKQLNFESFKEFLREESQLSLPLNQKWYKTEYDKETRFNRIICRKCNKSNVDDNRIMNRVKCPNCGFKGGIIQ